MKDKDLRARDDEFLNKHGILKDWDWRWINDLSEIEHENRNQERWSLSKHSYAAGYLAAKKEISCVLCDKPHCCVYAAENCDHENE